MTSPLFSVPSADFDTDKDARGKNARWESGGECKDKRGGGGEQGESDKLKSERDEE